MIFLTKSILMIHGRIFQKVTLRVLSHWLSGASSSSIFSWMLTWVLWQQEPPPSSKTWNWTKESMVPLEVLCIWDRYLDLLVRLAFSPRIMLNGFSSGAWFWTWELLTSSLYPRPTGSSCSPVVWPDFSRFPSPYSCQFGPVPSEMQTNKLFGWLTWWSRVHWVSSWVTSSMASSTPPWDGKCPSIFRVYFSSQVWSDFSFCHHCTSTSAN